MEPERFKEALNVYSTPDGKRNLAKSVVLHMDILGFGAFSKMDPDRHLNALIAALVEGRDHALTEFSAGTHVTAWFSDNVAVGFPVCLWPSESEAVTIAEMMASRLQMAMAAKGYFYGGGIAIGDAYFKTDFIFGKAIVDAVKQEDRERDISGGAMPRVLLTAHAAAVPNVGIKSMQATRDPKAGQIDCSGLKLRRTATENLTYVSYLDWMILESRALDGKATDAEATLALHRDAIQGWLGNKYLPPRVVKKIRWLSSYHNEVCQDTFPTEDTLLVP